MSSHTAPQERAAPENGGHAAAVRRKAPAERGTTLIAPGVVARVAARAAHEALVRETGQGPARRALGRPHSSVYVGDGATRLAVSVALPYPVDISRTCEEMAHYIAGRVGHLTGMRIEDVTVSVRRLVQDRRLG
jgi:uncharacterized alkaline shock family protein YloU